MTTLLDLGSYDHILVAFSGGKDSLACVLHLLECGVDPGKIELHHHDVDGGSAFMDWPCTPAYCRAIAAELDLPIYFSYKQGGFLREMNRTEEPTAPTFFETPDGIRKAGGEGPNGTRGLFPQVSANLSVRWCSAYLKIDVLAASIRNQERFNNSRTLVVTGERAEESTARAKYLEFEPHRSDARTGRKRRLVDAWRPIHKWPETEIWAIIRRFGIVPHIAYQLGWGRLSCLSCIFGSPNQWATINAAFSEHFEQVAARETATGKTIQRSADIRALAAKGTPYAAALSNPELVRMAMRHDWTLPVRVSTDEWKQPAGAFGENAGPI